MMNKQIEKVFSENPEKDLWRELSQFTYKVNIERFLKKEGHDAEPDTINCIAGSFLQAYEYYKSAINASLQIAPLLLYYGSTNLLYGMANLFSGNINDIKNHGMKVLIPERLGFIADVNIRFLSPGNGSVHVFSKAFGYDLDLTNFGAWEAREFLDSIAEIDEDYKKCYNVTCGKIVMLDVFNTPDGKVEKVYFNEKTQKEIADLLSLVDGFHKSYLNVMTARDNITKKEYFVLRHKLNGKDISELSFSGQPYLRAAHEKNGQLVTVPTVINMYVILFALATLCRYYPERWSPFVQNDSTGEKLLIEKFLYFSRRMIPNIVLNSISKKNVQYVSDKYHEADTIKFVGEHQIKEIVEKEVKRDLEKEKIFKKF